MVKIHIQQTSNQLITQKKCSFQIKSAFFEFFLTKNTGFIPQKRL